MKIVENTISIAQSAPSEFYCQCGNTPEVEGFDRLDLHNGEILFLYRDDLIRDEERYVCLKCGRILELDEYKAQEFVVPVGVMKHHQLTEAELDKLELMVL